jgi:hypothetical protein
MASIVDIPMITDLNDTIGTAHLVPMAGARQHTAIGRVKGMLNKMYLPTVVHGLAGYTAPNTRLSDNAMVTTIPSAMATTTCSITMLIRFNQPIAGTLIRWEGGFSYLYCSATGELQLEGPSAHVIATAAEFGGPGIWHRLTLIRDGSTTIVYIDNINVRTTARAINIPAGTMDVLSYQSTRVSPSGYDISGIKITDHQLSVAEIAALVTADGENPTNWAWYNVDGSDYGEGCIMSENGLTAGGFTGFTYFDIENIPGVGNRTKLWTNGESCRYGKAYYVGSKTKLYCYFKYYIPSENIMNADHSSPGFQFSLIQFQSSALITDSSANWIAIIQAIWEDPGDGARVRRYRTSWYNAAGVVTNVDMDDADIPLDREFVVKAEIEYDGANSIIKAWIDGVQVTNIVNADFTGKAAIASVMAFPYNGVHQSMKDATNSYAVYMGTQYVGDVEYMESTNSSHKRRLKANKILLA